MKKLILIIASCILILSSCKSEPSLEKYFVENSENKNFVQVDISSNILNIDKINLSNNEKLALQNFNKINILAFKLNDSNKSSFDNEKTKVNAILKNTKYQQLMKSGSGKQGAQISYLGEDDNISEFVVFGNNKESGFAIVRVLGKDMNPNSIITMLSVLKKSNIDLKQFEPLENLMN